MTSREFPDFRNHSSRYEPRMCRIRIYTLIARPTNSMPGSPFSIFINLLRDDKLNPYYLIPSSFWPLAWLVLRHRRWRWHVCLKCCLSFNKSHGVLTQKLRFFTFNHTQHKHPYIAATTIRKIQHQKQPTHLRSKIATNITTKDKNKINIYNIQYIIK
jgi:hypothetical protein